MGGWPMSGASSFPGFGDLSALVGCTPAIFLLPDCPPANSRFRNRAGEEGLLVCLRHSMLVSALVGSPR